MTLKVQQRSGWCGAPPGALMNQWACGKSPLSPQIRELGLQKIICPLAFRLNKALIAQCMMVGTAAVYRDLGKHYGQNRVSYRGGCVGHESAFITGICKSGEWSNRRRGGGWTDRWSVAGWRPGVTARSAAAGLLRACAGLCRGACLPSRSRALLGWIWLASSPRPGLRLISELSALPA